MYVVAKEKVAHLKTLQAKLKEQKQERKERVTFRQEEMQSTDEMLLTFG